MQFRKLGSWGTAALVLAVVGCKRPVITKAPPPPPAASAPAPTPTIVATPQPAPKTTIRGGAWVTWGNGTSDVLRGMSIAVIQRRTSAELVSGKLTEAIAAATAIAEKERAGRDRVINGARVVDNIPTQTEKDREIDRGILQQAMDNARQTGGIDVKTLRSLSEKTTRNGTPLLKWEECVEIVAGVKTGIDGKFEVTNLPPGDYYLIASSPSTRGDLHWFVPISATGADMTLDLSIDNAEKAPRPTAP